MADYSPVDSRKHFRNGSSHTNLGQNAEPYHAGYDADSTFQVPSYLRGSRYTDRLRVVYEQTVADIQEQANKIVVGRQLPLSASSSSANLHKLYTPQVHRSVVQDVIERLPPQRASEEGIDPLPSRLNELDKQAGLEILADGHEARFTGVTKSPDDAAAVRTDYPVPKECGIFYFEVTILSRGKEASLIGLGFATASVSLARPPGWEKGSWAYHGDDGYAFKGEGSGGVYGPRFGKEDVIGCGINFRTGSIFFTKNGTYLGPAFSGIKDKVLFPFVGMKKANEHIRINFGQTPFVFDIDTMVSTEKQSVLAEIGKTDVSSLNPPDDESSLIQNLVAQYLAHEGYVETAKAFANDIHEVERNLGVKRTLPLASEEDDVHAIQRQRIRRSILEGDVDRALKYTTSYYPHILESERNRNIYFRLRCRKFIEMMKRHAEYGHANSTSKTMNQPFSSLGSNDHIVRAEKPLDEEQEAESEEDEDEEDEEPLDTQMELDGQIHREALHGQDPLTGDIDMDASQELPPRLSQLKSPDLLSAAIAHGQELSQEFGNDPDPRNRKLLSDLFSVMAYPTIADSPVAHLFDDAGRTQVAEEVNGAILVSLGKPSDAALETMCAHTEALLDETARHNGGAAALINVRRDFLQP